MKIEGNRPNAADPLPPEGNFTERAKKLTSTASLVIGDTYKSSRENPFTYTNETGTQTHLDRFIRG